MEQKSRKTNPPRNSSAKAFLALAMLATVIGIVDTGGRFSPISSAWAGMGTGMVMMNGGVTTGFNAVDTGGVFNGIIGTKLAGTAFKLDILALKLNNTTIDTNFTGSVAIQLLDSSDNTTGTAVDGGTGCRASWINISGANATVTFAGADKGRKEVSFTVANAYRDVRVMMDYTYTYMNMSGQTITAHLTSCSSDNFSIRPTDFTVTSNNATNETASGNYAAKVGTNFNLTAAAMNSAGNLTSGYDGTPAININSNAWVEAHVGALTKGYVDGSFGQASSGVATGNSFTYSEVGNFRILPNGVYDRTFTQVDSNKNECTTDYSNSLNNNQYGCYFGNQANQPNQPTYKYFGRFFPDRFAVTAVSLVNRSDLQTAAIYPFTYMGEPMTLYFTIAPQNGSGGQLNNYTGNYAKLDLTNSSSFDFAARDTTLTDGKVAGTTDTYLTNRLIVGVPSTAVWSGPSANVVATVTVIRNATPDGPYDWFRLGINPVDSDGVTLLTTNPPLDLDADAVVGNDHQQVGLTRIRFGKMAISSAYGPERNSLPMPMEVQYCQSGCLSAAPVFVKNDLDSLTPLVAGLAIEQAGVPVLVLAGKFRLNNQTGSLGTYPATKTLVLNGTGLFTAGAQSMLLPAPNAAGSLDVTYDLTTAVPAMTYLQTGTNYAQNPTARATFGVYRNPSQLIYMRENF